MTNSVVLFLIPASRQISPSEFWCIRRAPCISDYFPKFRSVHADMPVSWLYGIGFLTFRSFMGPVTKSVVLVKAESRNFSTLTFFSVGSQNVIQVIGGFTNWSFVHIIVASHLSSWTKSCSLTYFLLSLFPSISSTSSLKLLFPLLSSFSVENGAIRG